MTTPVQQNDFDDAKPEYQVKRSLWVLLIDLLKYAYVPDVWEKDSRWRTTIRNHRCVIHTLLAQNPDFKDYLHQEFVGTYADAVETAAAESRDYSPDFPQTCPWTEEEVLDLDYLPEPAEKQMPPLN